MKKIHDIADLPLRWMLVIVAVGYATLALVDSILAQSGWAVQIDGRWGIKAQGWQTLLLAWPLPLVGGIVVWILNECLSAQLYERTQGRELERQAQAAKTAAANAQRIAEAGVQQREKQALAAKIMA